VVISYNYILFWEGRWAKCEVLSASLAFYVVTFYRMKLTVEIKEKLVFDKMEIIVPFQ